MKVATVTNSMSRKAGGFFTSVRRSSQTLALLPDTQVNVICVQDEFSTADLNVWESLVPECFPLKGPTRFGFSPMLKRHLLQSDHDIVHQHGIWQFISMAVSRWHKTTHRPYVVSPRGMLDPWALDNLRWKKQLAGLLFENRNLNQAACLHALCEAEAEAMRAYGLKNPICIIPNGIDLPEVKGQKMEVNDALSSVFRLPTTQQKVLLYLGRIHPKKGLANLLRAWAQIKTENEWILVVAGWDEGGHQAELKLLASELGLSWSESGSRRLEDGSQVSVNFRGPQFNEDKAACYQSCDAFILPSFSEGLPMTVLEAWSYGKPVLMTPQCNLPEGFMANAAIRIETDIESIAAGLQELFKMSDSDICARGNNGRELALTRFTWSQVATNMHSVYEWLLGGGEKPNCVIH